MRKLTASLLVFVAALPPVARATFCPPVATTVYVGNTATDNQCDHDSIQAAIDAASCPATIVVTAERNYSAQHLVIVDKVITLTGRTQSCGMIVGKDAVANSTAARIPLAGNGTQPVISISGTGNIILANFEIHGGYGDPASLVGGGGIAVNGGGVRLALRNLDIHDNQGGYGGGVAFYGTGRLSLDGVSIHANHANGDGGGLSVLSSFTGHVDASLLDNASQASVIVGNSADGHGGGIALQGSVHFSAVMSTFGRASVVLNQALYGGGLSVSGGASADLALPNGGISGNAAEFGGGIFIAPANNKSSVVRLINTDPGYPVMLVNNDADASGGGIYLNSGDAGQHATACLHGVSLRNNSAAQHGSAVAVADFGRLLINPLADGECDPAAASALGAVECAITDPECNAFQGNYSSSAGVNDVATIDVDGPAEIRARRLRLDQNQGGYIVRSQDAASASIHFSQCLFHDNSSSKALVSLSGGAAHFDGCTFARDSIGGSTVFVHDSGIELTRSIVQEAVPVFDPNVAGLEAQYLILNNPKLPAPASVHFTTAQFVDADGGDFHLDASSPANDFAPPDGESRDLDNRPRDVDMGAVPNVYGTRDLGAFERQPVCYRADTVYCDGFDPPEFPPAREAASALQQHAGHAHHREG